MKKLAFVLALLLAVLPLAGCRRAEVPTEPVLMEPVQEFASRKHGYRFNYAAGLMTGDADSNMDVLLYEPLDERYLANFSVTCVEGEVKLDIMTEDSVLESLEYEDAAVTRFEFGTFCGQYSLRVALTLPVRGMEVVLEQVLFNHGGYHFILTSTYAEAQQERMAPVFEQMLTTFRLESEE